LFEYYRVLLPKRLFQEKDQQALDARIREHIKRSYPHYLFIREENGFAICERK